MTNNIKDKISRCGHRIRYVNKRLARETERIGKLDQHALIQRLELITEIRRMWDGMSMDQLRHLNTILELQSSNHDMSIAICKCAKDLEISIPEEIESPNKFHKYVLEQIKLKK